MLLRPTTNPEKNALFLQGRNRVLDTAKYQCATAFVQQQKKNLPRFEEGDTCQKKKNLYIAHEVIVRNKYIDDVPRRLKNNPELVPYNHLAHSLDGQLFEPRRLLCAFQEGVHFAATQPLAVGRTLRLHQEQSLQNAPPRQQMIVIGGGGGGCFAGCRVGSDGC